MNKINEIGDTKDGQKILGRTAERAYQRAQRTSGADKKRFMRTYNDAYKTGGKSSNKHLGGSREYFDNGRDYEYEKWADEHNGNVAESKTMNKKLMRLTEQDLHRIVKESVKRVLKESAFNEYEVSFVFFAASTPIDKLLSKLDFMPNIQVQDVYEDDDNEWNVECVARVSCTTIEEVDSKMHKLLDRAGLTSWDYHYIKGLDNHEYWQP